MNIVSVCRNALEMWANPLLFNSKMDKNKLFQLLTDVSKGRCDVKDAAKVISDLPMETSVESCIDHHRALRTGIPEVIYGQSKTPEQIISIGRSLLKRNSVVIATKVDEEKAAMVLSGLPSLNYHEQAMMLSGNEKQEETDKGRIVIVSGGTSDIPIAEEAKVTVMAMGHPVSTLYDVGVAGLHRILGRQRILREARVIIVVAGMEGALPSVVSGLVECPVIGVPTSVGYGTGFGGIAALLSMLNSCAPGIGVVNIDNGFGAACLALSINR